MAELPEIALLGNPILRQAARLVENVAEVDSLIDTLMAKVVESQGVGIAAPQISQSLRLIIVASYPNARYPHAPKMPPTVMINPDIVSHSQNMVKGWEGCLSVPGIRGIVPRYSRIEVTYLNREGQFQQQSFTDFVARIIQHELDHLNGITFLDRVETSQNLVTEPEYQRRYLPSC
ncbi:MAG: peptide deformylase [Chroococcales cyanobacterium]